MIIINVEWVISINLMWPFHFFNQVITNTEAETTAGFAVVYEAAVTVMEIAFVTRDKLRVFAIHILGRFLSQSDSNIRWFFLKNNVEFQ